MIMNSPKIQLWTATDPHQLQQCMLEEYIRVLQNSDQHAPPPVWLCPSHRARLEILRQLVQRYHQVIWGGSVQTIDQFAIWLVKKGGSGITPINAAQRRHLLRRVIQELHQEQRLSVFRAVAERPGFLAIVDEWITELKREEIWPDQLSRAPVSSREQFNELELIYQRYQQYLLQHHWYDIPGLMWQARTYLDEGKCDPLNIETVFISGFSDFTHPQLKILKGLAQRCKLVMVSLLHDQGIHGPFRKTQPTANYFQQLAQETQRQFVWQELQVADEDEPPARRVIRQGLFRPPQSHPRAEDLTGLEILCVQGPTSEKRAIARRIKQLLHQGVSAAQIVVGLRRWHEEGEAWVRYLRESGIPVWSEWGVLLSDQGIIRFILNILETEVQDWPLPSLLGVLRSSYYRPEWTRPGSDEDRRKQEQLRWHQVRLLHKACLLGRVPRGRQEIWQIVCGMVSSPQFPPTSESSDAAFRDDTEPHPSSIPTQILRSVHRLLHGYDRITARLRENHTLDDWALVLNEIVNRTGALKKAARGTSREQRSEREQDVQAWDAFQRLLRELAAVDHLLPSSKKRSLAEFLQDVTSALSMVRLEVPREDSGCVQLLSVDQLRYVSSSHVFLVDFSEDSYPRHSSDDCLFGERQREIWADRGLPVRHRTRHQQDEILLCYEALLAATRQLTLSYTETDQHGQPVLPSPYLPMLRQLWQDQVWRETREGSLSPLPDPDCILTPAEMRCWAVKAACEGMLGWLRQLLNEPDSKHVIVNVLAALKMNLARFHTQRWTTYDGCLQASPNIKSLARDYGRSHAFSAGELETYGLCPFRFYLERVLCVESLPELHLGRTRLELGNLWHRVLAQALKSSPTTQIGPHEDLLKTALVDLIRQQPPIHSWQRVLWSLEFQQMLRALEKIDQQFQDYAERLKHHGWEELHSRQVEVAFGVTELDSMSVSSLRVPCWISQESEIHVCGRIDLVEVGRSQGRNVFNIVDYKTGPPPPQRWNDVLSGRTLQVVLYGLVAQRMGLVPPDAEPAWLGYWGLEGQGFKPFSPQSRIKGLTAALWNRVCEILPRVIDHLVQGIRSGQFMVSSLDEECTRYCPYRTVCRVNQIRPLAGSLDKRRLVLDIQLSSQESETVA